MQVFPDDYLTFATSLIDRADRYNDAEKTWRCWSPRLR